MISVEEALSRILGAFSALPAETVALPDALGRVLAEAVVARVTQPPADVSAMDGYAVRAADIGEVPVRLRIAGKVPAGRAYDAELQRGEAVRIFTGAPLPAGADTIIIQENTAVEGNEVVIREGAPRGKFVRTAGLDFRAGKSRIAPGRRLSVREIGLAAAMNVPWLRVHRRPRVAILATGDEVVMPGDPLGPNQIVSSNGMALAAFVETCGGQAINLGIARDDRDSLVRMAEGAAGADVLVTTGGASVGEHDLIHSVLGESGLEVDFWKIAMRPGKPLIFGHLRGTPLLGLPGNPVSTIVCALLYLKPALARLQGLEFAGHETRPGWLGADLPENDQRQDYLRAAMTLDDAGHTIVTPFARQDSSMLATLAEADGLIVRPPHAPATAAGSRVEWIPFAPLGASL